MKPNSTLYNYQERLRLTSSLRAVTFNGYNQTVIKNGHVDREIEYIYTPFPGISVVSAIYVNAQGNVLATQVLSESSAGGSSTIGDQ